MMRSTFCGLAWQVVGQPCHRLNLPVYPMKPHAAAGTSHDMVAAWRVVLHSRGFMRWERRDQSNFAELL